MPGTWESGHLHDSGVPPDRQCSRSVEPQPTNSTGGSSFAACRKELLPGVTFEGTRDVRVVDRARTLWVAVWLHWLDMAEGGKALASETLEASRHCLGPLLESFLTPGMSNLMFQEVVDCILNENRRASQQSLHYLRGHHACDREVLDGLIKAHRELDKAA